MTLELPLDLKCVRISLAVLRSVATGNPIDVAGVQR